MMTTIPEEVEDGVRVEVDDSAEVEQQTIRFLKKQGAQASCFYEFIHLFQPSPPPPAEPPPPPIIRPIVALKMPAIIANISPIVHQ